MKLKNYLKGLLFFFIPFILLLLIIHTFYYFDIFSNQIMKYLKIIIILISSLTSGFYIGYTSNNKGYLNGLKFSLIIIMLFFITNLFISKFKFITLIYYLIISLVIIIGSMIGINKKENK